MAGLFLCEIHGEAGLLPVCKHLHQKMLADDNPGQVITTTYYFGDFAGDPEAPMIDGILYCLTCAQEYQLPKEDSELLGSEAGAVPDEVILATCEKCFDEYWDKYK